ncbi:MAG: prepilin-type N-terminal cleavage/methylation domain-containing protein [Lachnospiraceae bacterium]|nr:prepilin-type N-terminal cleavage/methylation domain-containing protein [Lachnospiraceae bacterium]
MNAHMHGDRLRRGGRKKTGCRFLRSVKGMTLIELIVGLAISSVVSLMAAQFFSIVVRLHRSSTELSVLQKEAQTISVQLTRAIMNAEEVYFHDNGRECVLILGREDGDGREVRFTGEIFYYSRNDRRLYADTGFDGQYSRRTLFNSLHVQSEIRRIQNDDYLVSNKVEDLRFSLSEDLKRMVGIGNHTYRIGDRIGITAEISMQYHDSRSYACTVKAVPRAPGGEITWRDES